MLTHWHKHPHHAHAPQSLQLLTPRHMVSLLALRSSPTLCVPHSGNYLEMEFIIRREDNDDQVQVIATHIKIPLPVLFNIPVLFSVLQVSDVPQPVRCLWKLSLLNNWCGVPPSLQSWGFSRIDLGIKRRGSQLWLGHQDASAHHWNNVLLHVCGHNPSIT